MKENTIARQVQIKQEYLTLQAQGKNSADAFTAIGERYFLSPATVEAIIYGKGLYKTGAENKYPQK